MLQRRHSRRGDRLAPGTSGGTPEKLGTLTDRRHNPENATRITNIVRRMSVTVTTGRIPMHRESTRASTVTTIDIMTRLDGDGVVVIGHAVPLLIGIILRGLTAPWPELRVPRTRVPAMPTRMSARAPIIHIIERVHEDGERR